MTTTIPALVTEPELHDWLTGAVGERIPDDYETARLLIATFDLAAKDGSSLNNVHTIWNCLDNRPTSWHEPYTPPTVQAAAHGLLETYWVTRKPADYAARLVDLPMPVVVSRHQCPFCRRFTRANLAQVRDHMTRCWLNPVLRCCKTCRHHQDASGSPGSPDEWLESCTHPAGPDEGDYRFPVLHCPLHEEH